jgi:hypothetical protein
MLKINAAASSLSDEKARHFNTVFARPSKYGHFCIVLLTVKIAYLVLSLFKMTF